MEVYLAQIKDISNHLALVSVIIADENLVLITLNGLSNEYDSFKATIRAQAESITMDDLCSLLCSKAIHVELKNNKASSLEQPNVAFSAALRP